MLFLCVLLARLVMASPFGQSLRAIKGNRMRAGHLGIATGRHLVGIYTLAAFMAGLAGALNAQTTQFVSLEVLDFNRSADVLLILILGGSGYLYGGLIGAVILEVLQTILSDLTPQYWHFWIGLLLVVIVLAGRERRDRARARPLRTPRRRRGGHRRGDAVSPALQTHGLVKRFGGLVATADVSLAFEKGARHALIGPNGAGKTTLINLLTGVLAPTSGTVVLAGEDVTHLAPHQRARRGIARTFQINQLFADMTPLDTVVLSAAATRGRAGVWWHGAARERESVERAAALLERFGLLDVMSSRVSSLPYGKQRLLEIAVAIASEPTVLLLDEPAAGVPEDERHEILAIVESLPKDVTVVLIEHDMDLVFSFANRITVLVGGAVFTEGTVEEIAANPDVRRVYLGEGDA